MKHSPITKAVCRFVRHIRLSKGLTCVETARRAGIPLGSFSCLERGHYRLNLESLFRILAALGADIKEVWPWECGQPVDQVTEQLIEQSSRARPRSVSIDDLLGAVCSVYCLDESDLVSGSRDRRISEARHVAAYILVRDCKHLQMARLARRLKLHPSSLSTKIQRRIKARLRPGSVLKRRIDQVRERLAELEPPPESAARTFGFEGAEAARAFADFLNAEFLGILSQVEEIAPHHLRATKVRCNKSTVSVTSTEELSGIFEICCLSFAAAWARKSPVSSRTGDANPAAAEAVRLLLLRAGKGRCAISGNGAKAAIHPRGKGA